MTATLGNPGGAGIEKGGAGIGIANDSVGYLYVNPGIDGAVGGDGKLGGAGSENGGIGIGMASESAGSVTSIVGGDGSPGGAGRLNGGIGIGIAKLRTGGGGILHLVAIMQ